MRILMPIALLSSVFMVNNALAESLEFSKLTIDTYQSRGKPVNAIMTLQDGHTHQARVQLQKGLQIKDLASGNLVFILEHDQVFEVTNATTDENGNKIVDIKPTNLFIGSPKPTQLNNEGPLRGKLNLQHRIQRSQGMGANSGNNTQPNNE